MREIPRKCSSCGREGHNSRTCHAKSSPCIKLDQMKKSNMGNLLSLSMGNLVSLDQPNDNDSVPSDDSGFLSDDKLMRKKGKPWTEEEHRRFLAGLSTLGKGNWRTISTDYVPTRTPAQVASHAQKYFLRKSADDRKKRRSSLFDISYLPDGPAESSSTSTGKSEAENLLSENNNSLLSLRTKTLLKTKQSLPPENSSSMVTNNFQQLCLVNYLVQVPPNPNYQPLTSQYPMELGFVPTSVHPWAADMTRFGYLWSPNSILLHPNIGLGLAPSTHTLPLLPSSTSSSPPAITNNNSDSDSKESNGDVTETQTAEKWDDLDVVLGLGPPIQLSTTPSSLQSSSS